MEVITTADVLAALQSVRPEANFSSSVNFIADGLLDSFDVVILVSELERRFGVTIDGALVVPANFKSADAIVALVENLKGIR